MLTAVVGLVLLAVAATADTMGRFLALVAGAGLVAVALTDLVLRPRLRADGRGLTARTLGGRVTLDWSEVQDVRVDERRGVAVRSTLLEIDAGETLVLLGRRSLGANPRDVAPVLRALRAGRNPDAPGADGADPWRPS
jgi:Bacterial PH domain